MKILLHYWKLNFLSVIEYKISFLIQVFSMVVNDILFVSVWYMFFMKFGTIGGMDFSNFAVLMTIMVFVFAIVHIFFGGYHSVPIMIEEGKLDSHLLLPKNILVRIISNNIMVAAFGDIVFGFMLMYFVPNLSFIFVIKIIILSIIGAITFLGFLLIFASLSFYIGSSRNLLRGMFEAVLGPSHYPPGIFEGTILKYIFMTVLPIFYIVFLPYNLVIYFNIYGFLNLILGSIFFLSLGTMTFYKGLKRYESGNMLNTNV